jgi:dolichol-phosphate mannosyltransferase
LKTLVLIPTYNERENIAQILQLLDAERLDADILFVDDGSPDGTGLEIERFSKENSRIHLLQRGGKQGIGSAHLDGIRWAYAHGYERLVTMDCDLTHLPADIPALLAALANADVAIGTRYRDPQSLKGWNWGRKSLTLLAHLLTRFFLGIPYDCTGAFRAYRLDRIPESLFEMVASRSYPFFFESLFLLHHNTFKIAEIAISLPPRTYGSSKMSAAEPFRGVRFLIELARDRILLPERFGCPQIPLELNPALPVSDGWNAYWERSEKSGNLLYKSLATLFRRGIIAPRLTHEIHAVFRQGDALLHAGCGSGHVDRDIQAFVKITALDSSPKALDIYRRCVPLAAGLRHASVFSLPFDNKIFDGAYNLGVIEHFSPEEISRFLSELHRVIKPGGRLLLFWPHRRATSVLVLKIWHHLAGPRATPLHPPEISLAAGKKSVAHILEKSGFHMDSYAFDFRDFWVQAVIRATRIDD